MLRLVSSIHQRLKMITSHVADLDLVVRGKKQPKHTAATLELFQLRTAGSR